MVMAEIKSAEKLLTVKRILGWGIAPLSSIIDWLVGLSILRNSVWDIFEFDAPEVSYLAFVLFLELVLIMGWLLNRKITSITLPTRNIEYLPKRSVARRACWALLVVAFVSMLCIPYALRQSAFSFPAPTSDISIYVDQWDILGHEDVKFDYRIIKSLREMLGDTLPLITVHKMPPPPRHISGLQDRLDWACEGGAVLIIYGRGDKGLIEPSIRICDPISESNLLMDLSLEVTPRGIMEDKYFATGYSIPSVFDVFELCAMDTVPHRAKYLAVLGLGLTFLYGDLPEIAHIEQIEAAQDLFQRAIELAGDKIDCQLNYCAALFYRAEAEYLWAVHSSEADRQEELYLRALQNYKSAVKLNPDFWEAMLGVANSSHNLERYSDATKRKEMLRDANYWFALVRSTRGTIPVRFYTYWGYSLALYGDLLKEPDAGKTILESLSLLSHAIWADSMNIGAWNNFGVALGIYASRESCQRPKETYQASVMAFEEALRISPDYLISLFGMGLTLQRYAVTLNPAQSIPLFKEAIDKFDQLSKVQSWSHVAFVNSGRSLLSLADDVSKSEREAVLRRAGDQYASATVLGPDNLEEWFGLGLAQSQLGHIVDNEEADSLFGASFVSFSNALAINEVHHPSWGYWGKALFWSALRADSAAQTLLTQALGKYRVADSLSPDNLDYVSGIAVTLAQMAIANAPPVADSLNKAATIRFADCLDINPKHCESWLNLSNCLIRWYWQSAKTPADRLRYNECFERIQRGADLNDPLGCYMGFMGMAFDMMHTGSSDLNQIINRALLAGNFIRNPGKKGSNIVVEPCVQTRR